MPGVTLFSEAHAVCAAAAGTCTWHTPEYGQAMGLLSGVAGFQAALQACKRLEHSCHQRVSHCRL